MEIIIITTPGNTKITAEAYFINNEFIITGLVNEY